MTIFYVHEAVHRGREVWAYTLERHPKILDTIKDDKTGEKAVFTFMGDTDFDEPLASELTAKIKAWKGVFVTRAIHTKAERLKFNLEKMEKELTGVLQEEARKIEKETGFNVGELKVTITPKNPPKSGDPIVDMAQRIIKGVGGDR